MTTELTAERVRELFDLDPATGRLICRTTRNSHALAGSFVGVRVRDGYLKTQIDGRAYLVHRLVWLYVYGVWPSGEIDHINGNSADNRPINLRECSGGQNRRNSRMRLDNTTGFRNVERFGNRFRAVVRADGVRHRSSSFATAAEAGEAAREMTERLHGEFAVSRRPVLPGPQTPARL